MNADELHDMAGFVTDAGMQVEDWEVTFKESIDMADMDDIIATISENSDITVTEDKNVKKYLAVDMHKSSGITVSYEVILPRNGAYSPELIAVVKGKAWNKVMEANYQSEKETFRHQLFTDAVKVYTCLTTHSDGIMSSDDFLEQFVNYFNIQQQHTQLDTVENSSHKKIFYGYNPIWVHSISINGTQTNVQVAVTQDNEEEHPKYTIGTPILINEY
jgi:hypothetical protein